MATLSAITACQERGLERAILELSRHEGVQGVEAGVGREGLGRERGVGRGTYATRSVPYPMLLGHHDAHLPFWNAWAVPTAPVSQAQMAIPCRLM